MLSRYLVVMAFTVLGAVAVLGMLVVGKLIRPHRPGGQKDLTYECGENPIGSGWINFNYRFYMIALIFIVFDVEVALMFPVASVFHAWVTNTTAPWGLIALTEIALFVGLLSVGLVFVWAKGDLGWIKELLTDKDPPEKPSPGTETPAENNR